MRSPLVGAAALAVLLPSAGPAPQEVDEAAMHGRYAGDRLSEETPQPRNAALRWSLPAVSTGASPALVLPTLTVLAQVSYRHRLRPAQKTGLQPRGSIWRGSRRRRRDPTSRDRHACAAAGALERGGVAAPLRSCDAWSSGSPIPTAELAPVIAHGYPQHLVTRMGTIPRDAENATAAAFRTGLVQMVGGRISQGAIAAPLLSPAGPLGVMAAELLQDGERRDATRAAVTIVAAQLSTLMGPPPARGEERTSEAVVRSVVSALQDRPGGSPPLGRSALPLSVTGFLLLITVTVNSSPSFRTDAAPQVLRIVDGGPVEVRDHIAGLQSRLRGRGVVAHRAHQHPVLGAEVFGELW